MVQYSRLANNYILLLSFLLLSSAMPACLTSSRRPSPVSVGDALLLKPGFSIVDSPTGYQFGGCRDVYQHHFPLHRGLASYWHYLVYFLF